MMVRFAPSECVKKTVRPSGVNAGATSDPAGHVASGENSLGATGVGSAASAAMSHPATPITIVAANAMRAKSNRMGPPDTDC